MEGLSLALKCNQEVGLLSGIKVSHFIKILHLLFVDDILLMTSGTIEEWKEISRILNFSAMPLVSGLTHKKLPFTTMELTLQCWIL
jgi:hypothetical protein